MFSEEATNTNFIIFSWTRPVLEPTTILYSRWACYANISC